MHRDVSGRCHGQCGQGGVCEVTRYQGVGDAKGHHGQLSDHHGASVPHDGGAFGTHRCVRGDGGGTASHPRCCQMGGGWCEHGSIHAA